MPKIKSKIPHDEVVQMYGEGYEIAELAYIFGSNNAYIREILRKKKVQLRPENGIDVGKIKALRRAGWTVTAIAFEMCLPAEQITEVLQGDK